MGGETAENLKELGKCSEENQKEISKSNIWKLEVDLSNGKGL